MTPTGYLMNLLVLFFALVSGIIDELAYSLVQAYMCALIADSKLMNSFMKY